MSQQVSGRVVRPRREFTADAIENTKELNQKAFTAFWIPLSFMLKENWIVVASKIYSDFE